MGLTEQQACAAYSPKSVAVTAGVGTGKTHMLSERYRYFLEQGFSPLQIVAVTFTEKAAAELRSRIRATIAGSMGDGQRPVGDHRPDLLAELEAARISTFHALAARICREHYDKAKVPPDFAVQDELESPIWLADVFAEALAQLPNHLYQGISYSLMRDVLWSLLKDPLTAEQALQQERVDWLPQLLGFKQSFLESIACASTWINAREQLHFHIGPTQDKRELVRQDALDLMSAFEESLDLSYLERFLSLSLTGGSKKKWADPASFEAVRDAINTLKDKQKGYLPKVLSVLESLIPNPCDNQTEALLPNLRGAFAWIQDFLQKAKYQQRVLDFNDLEVQALQALADPAVQQYYAQRWQVFLIDEFQDTNPIQGQLLETLTVNAVLTIVGDPKQSIYGFRRADVRVFQAWQARIHGGDAPVELSTSFRTHQALISQINQVFAPVLGDLHQPLAAHRQETLEPIPAIQLYTVTVDDEYQNDKGIDTKAESCRRVEAQKIADLVEDMLSAKLPVHDKASNQLREIEPQDIAILSRTWGPLELYGQAIAARDIPILQAGGGNLLDTREAKDAGALLQFLADPTDNLALAAVLRSPFFAISDRTLYRFAQTLPVKTSWWKHLRDSPDPDLCRAKETLGELLIARRTEAPSRLLQLGDRLTGYTAVIANLPGGDRRLADWQGFGELGRSLEAGSFDVLAVVRRLQRLQTAKVEVPRPALAGGNAVNLMTIHGAKGLEWPVVIVPDLARSASHDTPLVRFDPELGVALKLEDEEGTPQKSALYTLLEQRKKADEQEENKRVLYVALTRARDRLILTAAKSTGGGLDTLQPGLEGLITPTAIPFRPDLARPVAPMAPTIPSLPKQIMLDSTRTGFAELPVTALSDYAICPLRFKFRYVDGHPGYTSGNGIPNLGRELGTLTHKALEQSLDQVEALAPFAPHLPITAIEEALDLAHAFRHSPVYAAYQVGEIQREYPVSLTVGDLTLNGVVDLVGEDFVLDFKTDQVIHPEHHQYQLWAYSRATGKPRAHLAYLRHNHLHTIEAAVLQEFDSQAITLIRRLMEGDFTPKVAHHSCGICDYQEVCSEALDPSPPS